MAQCPVVLAVYLLAGGLLFLGVPSSEVDQLFFNAHRIHGPVRYPLLTANWQVVGVYDYQNASYTEGECGEDTCVGIFTRWQSLGLCTNTWQCCATHALPHVQSLKSGRAERPVSVRVRAHMLHSAVLLLGASCCTCLHLHLHIDKSWGHLPDI
jgi:hypothetical protein